MKNILIHGSNQLRHFELQNQPQNILEKKLKLILNVMIVNSDIITPLIHDWPIHFLMSTD